MRNILRPWRRQEVLRRGGIGEGFALRPAAKARYLYQQLEMPTLV